ncbi:MAG TPA: hypothetical protein PLF27_04765 [Sedimentibacter sp.]|nr:hypothetical protein [Sedimentibacter sp.]
MNNELMHNEDFIRCSTMIAELLMKYKAMEDKDAGEGGMQEEASCSLLFFVSVGLSNICYTLELKKSSNTCLGERHNKGLIGKLL